MTNFILGFVVGIIAYCIAAMVINQITTSIDDERPPMGDKEYERLQAEAERAFKIAELCNKGMSQRQIAKELGIHKKTVYRYMKKFNLEKLEEKK